jgi:hypothetical protein
MPKPSAKKIEPTALSMTVDPSRTEAAYAKYKSAALALPASGLANPTVNVTLAVAIATEGARNLLGQREELDALVRKVPWAVIERVKEVGLAAQHADMLVRLQEDEASAFGDLLPRTNELRSILLDDLELLVRRKLVPAKFVAEVRKGDNTVRDKANDLRDCGEYYTAHWAELSKRTTVDADEIAEAGSLATKILARLGAMLVTNVPKADEPTAVEMRRRMFSLLARDYDVVQRYGAFVFWELPDGWEAYVPSLWSGRRRSAGAAAPVEPVKEPIVTPT